MDDLISRQAAIEAFEKELSAKYNRRELAIGVVGIKRILDNLPSAQPKRKSGKWEEVSDDVFASIFYCSVCREEPPIYEGKYELTRFCPYCGADMRGEEHEDQDYRD